MNTTTEQTQAMFILPLELKQLEKMDNCYVCTVYLSPDPPSPDYNFIRNHQQVSLC